MKQEYPSLVLLDIMLPDEDGLTILKSFGIMVRPGAFRSSC